MVSSRSSRRCFRRRVCGGTVAVRHVPHVARGAQPLLRSHLLRLQFAPLVYLRALSLLLDRAIARRVPDGDGARSSVRDRDHQGRDRLGRLDAEDSPLMRLPALILVLATALPAHVGSPAVFYERTAGPYRLLVTIRPPVIVPGVAEIEIRSLSRAVRQIRIVPLPLTGAGAKFAPTPDVAQRSKQDPQFFTRSLWLMSVGEWQVRIRADGDQGAGELSVPVPALPTRTQTMQAGVGALLFVLMLVLAVGIVSIVGAGVRE